MARPLRFLVEVTIDPEEWANVYGVESEDVDTDVASYLRTLIQDCAASDEGCIVREQILEVK